MKIAFLACSVTMPGSSVRRPDAHEHDYQVDALSGPMRAAGLELIEVDWRDESCDWTQFDAALIGTTWDYWDYPQAFLARLNQLEALGVKVINPPDMVAWNSRKTYLMDLAEKGVPTIPTLWLSHPNAETLTKAFDDLKSDDLVIKRQIGAGAKDQIRLKRGEEVSDYPFDAMVQPFLKSIQTEGEYSFIMIDGELSHALIKKARPDDYRIQSMYGGYEERISPSSVELSSVKSVLEALESVPLYARVDMIRLDAGELALMELELIEPYLYPEQADRLGELMTAALLKRLS